MINPFQSPIADLPLAEIPIEGCTAFLSQAENHQILFMHFEHDTILPEHSHEAQVGFVLEGRIELVIDNVKYRYKKGERYYIPAEVKHSGKIFAGYQDITFFDVPDRYKEK